MPPIWSRREKDFNIIKYESTGDVNWLKNIVPRKYDLKDQIPIMISDRGELVCIPKSRDMPTVLFAGAKGSGKTLLLASTLTSCFHSMGYSCMHINDMTRETFTWHKPFGWHNPRTRLPYEGLRTPKRLPIVHVLFSSRDLRIPESNLPKWEICMPFRDILEDPEGYLGMDRTASAHYLSNMRKEFSDEKIKQRFGHAGLDLERIEKVIFDYIMEEAGGKMARNITTALMLRIRRLYDDGILDISSDNKLSDTMLKIKKRGEKERHCFNVLSGLMVIGAIPILHTDNIIQHTRFFKNYLSNQIKKVIDDQIGHPFFKDKKVAIFIDELTRISSRDRAGANPVIQQLVAQGRPMGIGTFYCTQNPSKLDPVILSNTKYFVSCNNVMSEAKVLTKEFSLEDRHAAAITHLDKKYRECLAYTTEQFTVFNPLENEAYSDKGPFIGEYIMPGCGCVPPKGES